MKIDLSDFFSRCKNVKLNGIDLGPADYVEFNSVNRIALGWDVPELREVGTLANIVEKLNNRDISKAEIVLVTNSADKYKLTLNTVVHYQFRKEKAKGFTQSWIDLYYMSTYFSIDKICK